MRQLNRLLSYHFGGLLMASERPRTRPAVPAITTTTTTARSDSNTFEVSCYGHTQKNYAELFQSGRCSDVTFIIITDEEGTCHRIPAHRVILASQSEYFDRLLFGEMREAQPGAEIPLTDTPLVAFKLLLKYVYTGSVNVKCELQLTLDVVTLADRFGLTHLKDAGDIHLVKVVNRTNVLLIFAHADLLRLERTKALCLETVDSNASFVLSCSDCLSLSCQHLESIISRDTFIVPEIKVFRAVQRWMSHNNKTKEDAADLLKAVRLCEIPPQELFGEVECSGLYSKEDIYEGVRIQQKPDWNSTLPRGRVNGGLFNKAKTTWVATYEDTPLHWFTKKDSSAEKRFLVKFSTLATNVFKKAQHPIGLKATSVVIRFDDLYFVNRIVLQLPKVTSYSIQISKDNKQWSLMVDHTKYKCLGMQRLHFPKQAFRYLRFTPVSGDDCEVDFVACSLSEKSQAFAIRDNGILAPLEAFEPQMKQSTCVQNSGATASRLLVRFNQPYSISTLRFVLTMNDPVEYENYDVSVRVTSISIPDVSVVQKSFVKVASQPCTIFEASEVTANFSERVVTHVLVEVNPVVNEDVQQAAKKRRLSDGSAPQSAQVKFTVASLMCWAS